MRSISLSALRFALTSVRRGLGCALVLLACWANAQFGPPPPSGPALYGATARLFGDNSGFSATMVMSTKENGEDISVPGKIAFREGKSRFEMDMTQMKNIKKKDADQMRSMGMDKLIAISRPDKKLTYQVWPGFKSYMEAPMRESTSDAAADAYKVDVSPAGSDTLDGHDCEKNRVTVTGKAGDRHESVVWNAKDLKKFPLQIETTEEGHNMRMTFKDVQLAAPAAELFEPPADFKRYNSMQEMMMTEMMKKEGNADREPAEDAAEAPADGKPKKSRGLKKLLPF